MGGRPKSKEPKDTRIAVRFPKAVIQKIDESIKKGLAESRSGMVRAIVSRHFTGEEDAIMGLARLIGYIEHPIVRWLAFSMGASFLSGAQSITSPDLDGQRQMLFEEGYLDTLVEVMVRDGRGSDTEKERREAAEFLSQQFNTYAKVREMAEQFGDTGLEVQAYRFFETLHKYAGRRLREEELAEMLSELKDQPVEKSAKLAHRLLRGQEKGPNAERRIGIRLTAENEEHYRRTVKFLRDWTRQPEPAKSAQEEIAAAGEGEQEGEGTGGDISMEILVRNPHEEDIEEILKERKCDSARLLESLQKHFPTGTGKGEKAEFERKTAAEFLSRLTGQDMNSVESALKGIELDPGDQSIVIELVSPADKPEEPEVWGLRLTCPEGRRGTWIGEWL